MRTYAQCIERIADGMFHGYMGGSLGPTYDPSSGGMVEMLAYIYDVDENKVYKQSKAAFDRKLETYYKEQK